MDFFEAAMKAAAESETARIARLAALKAEELFATRNAGLMQAERKRSQMIAASRVSPAEAQTTAEMFKAVAEGKMPMNVPERPVGYSPTRGGREPLRRADIADLQPTQRRPPTAAEGLEAILNTVRESDDVRATASHRITRVTMGITEIVSETDEE